jgi:hypothetical protein
MGGTTRTRNRAISDTTSRAKVRKAAQMEAVTITKQTTCRAETKVPMAREEEPGLKVETAATMIATAKEAAVTTMITTAKAAAATMIMTEKAVAATMITTAKAAAATMITTAAVATMLMTAKAAATAKARQR